MCGGRRRKGGKETVSPYSEWVGWSGVVGGQSGLLDQNWKKIGMWGLGQCFVLFIFNFFVCLLCFVFNDSFKLK